VPVAIASPPTTATADVCVPSIVLSDVLPTATFAPLIEAAAPVLVTAASWSKNDNAAPSVATCDTSVCARLPRLLAAPVRIDASPVDSLVDVAELFTTMLSAVSVASPPTAVPVPAPPVPVPLAAPPVPAPPAATAVPAPPTAGAPTPPAPPVPPVPGPPAPPVAVDPPPAGLPRVPGAPGAPTTGGAAA